MTNLNDKLAALSEALEPCPFCGGEAKLMSSTDGEVEWVHCPLCQFSHTLQYSAAKAIDAWNTRIAAERTASAEPVAGWIIGNGAGTKWRTWNACGPLWTDDRDKATRYARREDAELVHAEDIDAWRVEPYRDAAPSADVGGLVDRKYRMGDRVTKTKGSSWTGIVVGFYSASRTPIGYAVESENEPGSVQIYPESALAKHGGAA